MRTLARGLRRAAVYARTVRHLKASQVAWRIRYAIGGRFPGRPPAVPAPGPFDPAALERLRAFLDVATRHAPVSAPQLEAIRARRIRALDTVLDAREGVPWRPANVSRLTRYTLHYMDWLRTLAEAGCRAPNPADGALAHRDMADWVDGNSYGFDVGWDAFPLASRLINWSLALSVYPEAPERVRRSLAQQTCQLIHSLEYDVLANHLLKDAQALAVAASVLGAAHPVGARALEVGTRLLEQQMREQILPDGGHYERSVMYHSHVLEDSLIAQAALGDRLPELSRAIAAMGQFLAGLLYPDGEIPLFGDAVLHSGLPARALIAMASGENTVDSEEARGQDDKALSCQAFEASGFYVMRTGDGGARLTCKAGPPGPAYQLGHAHCDMLSFELTAGVERLVVDSGVYEYESAPMRAYCRGTSAHNTVRIQGREQMECWSSFRVGRRYTPRCSEWGERDGVWRLRAAHDGFHPYAHTREVLFPERRFWLIIDTLQGPGVFEGESFIHLHPEALLTEEDSRWKASVRGAAVTFIPLGADSVERVRGSEAPLQGWYCPHIGERQPSEVLILRKKAVEHASFGYAIVPAAMDVERAELWARAYWAQGTKSP